MNCQLCHSCTIAGMRDGVLFCGARWWLRFGSDEGAAEDERRRVNRQQIGELERLWKMP